mgnify:CR=1 FL=1
MTERDADGIKWDLGHLADFAHHEGLCSLGLQVAFAPTAAGDGRHRLEASGIDSAEFGLVHPGDEAWGRATSLAICAATTPPASRCRCAGIRVPASRVTPAERSRWAAVIPGHHSDAPLCRHLRIRSEARMRRRSVRRTSSAERM